MFTYSPQDKITDKYKKKSCSKVYKLLFSYYFALWIICKYLLCEIAHSGQK